MKTYLIIENGSSMEVTESERDILIKSGMIYHCPECGEITYHIDHKAGFEEIEGLLNKK